MHYVSKFNYFRAMDRLAKSMDEKPSMSEAVAGLSRFSLRDVFNNDEILLLYQQKTALEVLKKWTLSSVEVDADAIRENLHRQERYFVPQYVMKVNTPRYHAKETCEFLGASFENFETPPEIEVLGPEKVREFQQFCEKEWPNYKNKPIYVFWVHVGSHFKVEINPKPVSHASKEPPEIVVNLSEAELIDEINRDVDRLLKYARSTGLTGHLYAPAKKLYAFTKDPKVDPTRKQAFLELLKLKKAIKMLVFNFHRIELEMPEGLLSDELLEALGFLPCKACCGGA